MEKKLTWIEAAEIAGLSVRNMQRMRQRYMEGGYTGLFDQRRGKRSIHRVPMETVENVLALFSEKYYDFNVRHFHEKLRDGEGIRLSYSWVKQAQQGAGLVVRRRKRGPHRRRRPRRPLPGMLLHIDGSKIRKTKKAIRKALQTQIDDLGFSLVEILSPCPTNWRMTTVEAWQWIDKVMAKEFPLGVIKDITGKQDAD